MCIYVDEAGHIPRANLDTEFSVNAMHSTTQSFEEEMGIMSYLFSCIFGLKMLST